MQAQGNDFVILDGLVDDLPALTQDFIQNICDRHFGIGCDQLLVLQHSKEADVLMLIYNADGSQAANCGNGLRCVADLLMQKLKQDSVSIALADRVVRAKKTVHGIGVQMGQAVIEAVHENYTDVDMGNLHRVYFDGAAACPERNVEIILNYNDQDVSIKIIERGVGETLACGSGACATAVAVWQKTGSAVALKIHMPGGEVMVCQREDNIFLAGGVSRVCKGEFYAL